MTPAAAVAAIRDAIEARDTNPYRAAVDAGLPGTAIRHLLDGRQSGLGRLVEICNALDLEFYIGPRREEIEPSREWSNEGSSALNQFAPSFELPVREWVTGDTVRRTRVSGSAPAPEGLADPDAFYVRAGDVAMGKDGIWLGHYCLVCPSVPLGVGRRVWLRDRGGQEVLRRLVAVDADEYCLRACRIPESPHQPAPFFVHRWKRADVAAVGTVLAVYRDVPKVGKSQEPDVESFRRGLYLWLQEGTLGEFEQLRRALSALSGWQRAWGNVERGPE